MIELYSSLLPRWLCAPGGRRKHFFTAALAALSLAMLATSARAGTVTATFSNVNPGEVVTISSSVPNGSGSGWAGVYNFVNASGDLTGSFQGFCIDIAQEIYFNQTATFNVAALEAAPTPGTAMGPAKADQIRELWTEAYASIGTSNVKAAAFQVAIWEIINEKSTNNLDVTSGDFRLTAAQDLGLISQQANAWLAHLGDYQNQKTTSLKALTNDTYQDYVTAFPAPAPSGATLAGIGAGCFVLAALWRRNRAQSMAALVRVS